MKKRIKVHGFLIFLTVVTIACFPKVFLRVSALGPGEEMLTAIGMACVLLGQIVRLSSRGFKSEQSKNGFALVEQGPYGLVRNPMYLGIILIGAGIVMMLFKWWAICLFLAVFATIYIRLIFQEEAKLAQSFPGIYEAYRKKVPAIVPSIPALLTGRIEGYFPLKASWLWKETGSISGVLIFILLAKSWVSFKAAGPGICIVRLCLLLTEIFLAAVLAFYLIRKTDGQAKGL